MTYLGSSETSICTLSMSLIPRRRARYIGIHSIFSFEHPACTCVQFNSNSVQGYICSSLLQVLGYEERSLAHLLQKHCRVTANKQHQRADWRIR